MFIFTFHKSTAFNLIVSAKFKGFRTQAIKNDIEQRKEYCVVRLNTPCRQTWVSIYHQSQSSNIKRK